MGDNSSLAEQFLEAKIFVTNIKHERIKPYMLPFGFTDERLEEGTLLYQAVMGTQENQEKEYLEQFTITSELEEMWMELKTKFVKDRRVARVAVGDNTLALKALGLLKPIKMSFSGWVRQAKQFYTVAHNEEGIFQYMALYGFTKEGLQAGKQNVINLEEVKTQQEVEKSEAQDATRKRDDALDKLHEWISAVREIAYVALVDEPELREMLGISEPS